MGTNGILTTSLSISVVGKLGIFVRADGKWSDQVNSAASKANRTLGMMKKTFKCWSDDLVRIIYPTFIRPHLSVWNPNRKRDIDTLEKVQRRATKTIESRHLSYENRIAKSVNCFKSALDKYLEHINWRTHTY